MITTRELTFDELHAVSAGVLSIPVTDVRPITPHPPRIHVPTLPILQHPPGSGDATLS